MRAPTEVRRLPEKRLARTTPRATPGLQVANLADYGFPPPLAAHPSCPWDRSPDVPPLAQEPSWVQSGHSQVRRRSGSPFHRRCRAWRCSRSGTLLSHLHQQPLRNRRTAGRRVVRPVLGLCWYLYLVVSKGRHFLRGAGCSPTRPGSERPLLGGFGAVLDCPSGSVWPEERKLFSNRSII